MTLLSFDWAHFSITVFCGGVGGDGLVGVGGIGDGSGRNTVVMVVVKMVV